MSARALSITFDRSQAKGAAYALLLAIADYIGQDGTAYLYHDALFRKARLSRSHGYASLKALEALGEIAITPQGSSQPIRKRQGRAEGRYDLVTFTLADVVRPSDNLSTGSSPDAGQPLGEVVRTSDGGCLNSRRTYKEELDHELDQEIPPTPQGGEDALLEAVFAEPGFGPADLKALYAERLPHLRQIEALTGSRLRTVKARLREHPDPSWWGEYFARVHASPFLRDNARSNWLTFDWLMKDLSIAKVLEGNYDGDGIKPTTTTPANRWSPGEPRPERWLSLRDKIADEIGSAWAQTCFSAARITDDGPRLTIAVPPPALTIIESRFLATIMAIATREGLELKIVSK